MKTYDILILGGGASGLMCASKLDKRVKIAIVDSNPKVAQKLKISGGGKCNFTNFYLSQENYLGNKEFIKTVLDGFSKEKFLNYLRNNNLDIELKKGRYYFCKNSSDEIINILKKESSHAELLLNREILDVIKNNNIFEVKTQKEMLKAKKVIVATGGKSYQTLGASDIGLKIAKNFNIEVKEFLPALVGLTVQKDQFWMRELSGSSCRVNIKIGDKIIDEDLLFTHKGISGPAVLSASLYWQKGNISIDFLPKKDILEIIKDSKKLLSSAIPLPKKVTKAILEALHVKDMECKKIDQDTKLKLIKIHDYMFAPAGNFGFSKAEVCKGGVATDNLNPYTLESTQVKNLYFIGEVIDVTGELGGYNFQWAFSSAAVCANSINSTLHNFQSL